MKYTFLGSRSFPAFSEYRGCCASTAVLARCPKLLACEPSWHCPISRLIESLAGYVIMPLVIDDNSTNEMVRRWSCLDGMMQQLTSGGSSHADRVGWNRPRQDHLPLRRPWTTTARLWPGRSSPGNNCLIPIVALFRVGISAFGRRGLADFSVHHCRVGAARRLRLLAFKRARQSEQSPRSERNSGPGSHLWARYVFASANSGRSTPPWVHRASSFS